MSALDDSRRDDDRAPRAAAGYVGQPIRRVEDRRLLTGRGRFVADLALDRAAHLVVVRASHPAATITAIDSAAARAAPGVLGVWTGADLIAAGLGGIPWEVAPPAARGGPLGDPHVAPPQPVLAPEVVRYQGEPIAAVVADTLAAAEDAAQLIDVDYAPHAAV